MVAVLGISASSQEDLLRPIDQLGTNLLTVAPGQSLFGEQTRSSPRRAAAKIAVAAGVERCSSAVYDVLGRDGAPQLARRLQPRPAASR